VIKKPNTPSIEVAKMGIVQTLIEQSKNPSGVVGRIMLRIMNTAHRGLVLWGLADLQHGKTFLDVSCGGGNAIYILANRGSFERLYGIDFSQDSISIATNKNREHIENGLVTILQASVLELPFEDNFFDVITTFQSHYHWPDVLASMQEVRRVLKPRGQFVLVSEIYKIEYHMKKYNSVEKTVTLFDESGFKSIEFLSRQKSIRVIGYK
jgi:ubiquinone/menaquinone biosynthesis C-methylase UbiE